MLPIPLAGLQALCEGAAETVFEGAPVPRTQFSCLHENEWKRVKKLLRETSPAAQS